MSRTRRANVTPARTRRWHASARVLWQQVSHKPQLRRVVRASISSPLCRLRAAAFGDRNGAGGTTIRTTLASLYRGSRPASSKASWPSVGTEEQPKRRLRLDRVETDHRQHHRCRYNTGASGSVFVRRQQTPSTHFA